MNSIQFPNMFNTTTTNVVSDYEATKQNLKLLLLSDRASLFGDPYYGTILKKLMFDQNSVVLKDIVIDAIYTAILQFMPQIKVNRKDIEITQSGSYIYVKIKAKNILDFQTNMYNINLINYEED